MAIVDYRIRVIEKGRNLFETIKAIQKDVDLLNKTASEFKNETLDDVAMYIDDHRQRSIEKHTEPWRTSAQRNLIHTLRLGSALYRQSKDRWYFGIGEIYFLNQHAPYWYKVNYGGKIEMPANGVYGFFDNGKAPVNGGVGGVFHATKGWKGTNPYQRGKTGKLKGKPNKGNAYLMIPMKPIPPMYYLNRMAKTLNMLINNAWEQFKSKYK